MTNKSLSSEISGTVWKIVCNEGEEFFPGQELIILESMKMEIPIKSDLKGKIVKILVKEGELIEEEQKLIEFVVED